MPDGNTVELDARQKREHWQKHIECWQASGLSQVAYTLVGHTSDILLQ